MGHRERSCSICVAIVLRKARGFSDQTGERPGVEAEREEKDFGTAVGRESAMDRRMCERHVPRQGSAGP